MRHFSWIALLSLCACSSPAANGGGATEPATPTASATAPGEPALEPAQPTLRLPRNFLPTSVRARLGVDPTLAGFSGAIELTGDVVERSARFWLHGRGLTVRSAVAVQGDTRVALAAGTAGEDLLWLRPATPLPAGTWTLALEYEGRYETVATVGAIKQSVESHAYITTQFESIFARRVFPCFDEPNVKVPWQLTLDVPIDQVAVSNTPAVAEVALDAAHRRVVFAPTQPLPSYLIAFGVGPFQIVDAGKTRSGAPVRVIALQGHAVDATWAAQTAAPIVDALEDWFAMPYPYPKLDLLTIPVSSGFGAMENPGLITYVQRLILHDPKTATNAQRFAWVNVTAHEVAHQWFGDLVTPMWWDDIWLNEGFARWMQPKVIAALEGKLGAGLAGELGADFLVSEAREAALHADRLSSARRIRQGIESVGDIYNAFDRITYDKGASVLAMFEHLVGPEVMQRGVRAYLARYQHGNATSADFVASISEAAGRDVSAAFSTFLDRAGAPLVQGELRCEPGAPPTLRVQQQRFVVLGSAPADARASWIVPVCVAFDRDGTRAEACATLEGATAELPLAAKACPRWVMLNAGGHGYYRSAMPAPAYVALRDLGWKSLTPVERTTLFSDVSALAQTGQVDLGLVMSFVPKLIREQHHFALAAAVAFVDRTRPLISVAKRPAYDAWIRATFGAQARALGWSARRTDRLDAELVRRDVLALVARAGDPALRKAAVTLSRSWRTVTPAMRAIVWGVAADASPAVFAELLAAVVTEPDPDVRLDLLVALSEVQDEPRLREVLALLFEPRVDIRESQVLLFSAHDDAQREIVATYFQQHLEPLLARLPGAGPTGNSARFAAVFTQGCDAARRDELATYLSSKFGAFPGGPRAVAQSLERLDQCIAIKAKVGPSAEAWLAARS